MTAGDAEFLYLTTTGRRSGQPREIEIWFTQHEGRYYLVAEHREKTQWVQNVRANPAVRARVGDSEFDATARVVEAQTEPRLTQNDSSAVEEEVRLGQRPGRRDHARKAGLTGSEITQQAGEKGPVARRRPSTAREAYLLYVERAVAGAVPAQMGPYRPPAPA